MDNLRKIKTLTRPVFIAHGTLDTLVPLRQSERLYAAAREPKCYFAMPGCSHDEFPTPECFRALKAFLRETDGGPFRGQTN